MIRVFVYGTLLPGESNHHIAAPYLTAEPPVPGSIRGRLYDAGPYPGLVPDPRGPLVYGMWLTVTSEGLIAMDQLEEYYGPGDSRNDYDRILARDAHGELEGYVYVWSDGRGFPVIQSGRWKSKKS